MVLELVEYHYFEQLQADHVSFARARCGKFPSNSALAAENWREVTCRRCRELRRQDEGPLSPIQMIVHPDLGRLLVVTRDVSDEEVGSMRRACELLKDLDGRDVGGIVASHLMGGDFEYSRRALTMSYIYDDLRAGELSSLRRTVAGFAPRMSFMPTNVIVPMGIADYLKILAVVVNDHGVDFHFDKESVGTKNPTYIFDVPVLMYPGDSLEVRVVNHGARRMFRPHLSVRFDAFVSKK